MTIGAKVLGRGAWAFTRHSTFVIRHTVAPVLLAFLVALASPVFAQQDTWSGVERIVAVGDVHGDAGQLARVLRAAKVIDEKDNWIAGKTHLVQTGDVLDRGPDSRKAMDLLMKLEGQAAAAGGAVHPLLGNHEVMVLMDDWRYVDPGEEKAFGGAEEYAKAMGPDGKYGKWIRTHNTIIKINDILFVHAGLTPAHADLSLAEINKRVREELARGEKRGLAGESDGPLWDRSLAEPSADAGPEKLNGVLKKYGASRMVVGHTFSVDGVMLVNEGRLIRIDVGLSKGYGGPAACLVVDKGVYEEITDGKPARRLEVAGATTQPSTQPATAAGTPDGN